MQNASTEGGQSKYNCTQVRHKSYDALLEVLMRLYFTPLQLAMGTGNFGIVQELLDNSAVIFGDELSATVGLTQEVASLVNLLIAWGVPLEHVSTTGETVLQISVRLQKWYITEILIDAGCAVLPEDLALHNVSKFAAEIFSSVDNIY